jgi:flagellar hook-associated protein 3 FlgL
MRIPDLTVMDGITNQLATLGNQQTQLQNEVSTGQDLFQPSDNPSGAAQVLELQNQRLQMQQYAANTTTAMQTSQVALTGLQSLQSISNQVGAISTEGTSTLSAADAGSLATEVDQMLQEGVQAANTQNGDQYVFGGTAVTTPPFTVTTDASGTITGVTYTGTAAAAAVQIGTGTTITPGTSGTTNGQMADFLNQLVSLRDALNSADPATAVQAVSAGLATSENNLVDAISTQGALQARLTANTNQLTASFQANETQASNATNVDLPTTIVQLSAAQNAYQAALQSASNIMKMSLLNYIQ